MKSSGARLFVGLLLILFGVSFLLNNLNFEFFYFDMPYWLLSWKTIMLLLGLVIIATAKDKTVGFIFVFIGGIALASDIFHYRFWHLIGDFWPLILVAVGVYILFQRTSSTGQEQVSADGMNDDYIDDVAIFGGGKKKILSQRFRGGKVTSIFGGSEISLLESKLAPGDHVINVFALFGGTSFYVPKNWNVVVNVTPILGGFSDERMFFPDAENKSEGRLFIKGIVIFGGGEVKN